MPSAYKEGGLGCNPRDKSSKSIVNNLRSNSAKRNFVTISVSRNARFCGVRGKKTIESGIYLLVDFWGANAALLFYGLKWYNW